MGGGMRGNMSTEIRTYIDELFEAAPKTRKALEMKEEMISNAEEKLADFIAQGYQEEDAMEVVINSIGNIKELFQELEHDAAVSASHTELALELQQKKAKYTAIAVGLYIFAGAVFFFFTGAVYGTFNGIDLSSLGVVLGILCCIAPTGLLVYANNMIPKDYRQEDTVAEEYKEWKSGYGQGKSVRKAISSIIWTLTFLLYMVISFETGAWYITWVIFLAAGCLESIISLIYSLKKHW